MILSDTALVQPDIVYLGPARLERINGRGIEGALTPVEGRRGVTHGEAGLDGWPAAASGKIEGNAKRLVELAELLWRQTTDVIRQLALVDAHETIAQDPASCLRPSAAPTRTWLAIPSPAEKIGAQITVENAESIAAWRPTTTNTLDRLGSPRGERTR